MNKRQRLYHGNNTWDPAADCPGGIAGVHTGIAILTISACEITTVQAYNGTSFGSISITPRTNEFEV